MNDKTLGIAIYAPDEPLSKDKLIECLVHELMAHSMIHWPAIRKNFAEIAPDVDFDQVVRDTPYLAVLEGRNGEVVN